MASPITKGYIFFGRKRPKNLEEKLAAQQDPTFQSMIWEWYEEKDPESYRAMEKAGTLDGFCRERIEEAWEEYQRILMDLIEKNPDPEDYLEAVKHNQMLQGIAREIAIAHLFETD